jgi:predicted permease
VWLVACFNLAALQLAAFETRRAEFVTRAALGAGRWRLIRQLGAESAVIACTAAVTAVGLTHIVLQSLPAQLPVYVPFVTAPAFDRASWVFVGTLAALAALVMVWWPVRRLRLLAGMASERTVVPGSNAFRGLVTIQLAGTVALVIISTLLLSSRWTLASRDLGFNTPGVSIADVGLPADRYEAPESVVAFEDLLRERLVGGARTRAVALAYDHPLEANWLDGVAVLGTTPGADDVGAQAQLRIVSPGYFRAMGVQIVEGRAFEDFEGLGDVGVALVNQAFIRRMPLSPGRRIRQGSARRTWGEAAPDEFVVVGIVEDERFRGAEEDVEPALYLSTRQFPLTSASIVVASTSDTADMAGDIRAAVRDAEPGASLSRIRRLDDVAADQQLVRTLTTNVVGGLALIALVLASVGLHGLLTLMVSGRRRDIGIRLALGASRRSVVNRVIGDSLRPGLLGVGAGLMLAQLAGDAIRSMLVEISVLDPAVLIGVSGLMIAVGLLAAVVPARRAGRVDPARALRDTT